MDESISMSVTTSDRQGLCSTEPKPSEYDMPQSSSSIMVATRVQQTDDMPVWGVYWFFCGVITASINLRSALDNWLRPNVYILTPREARTTTCCLLITRRQRLSAIDECVARHLIAERLCMSGSWRPHISTESRLYDLHVRWGVRWGESNDRPSWLEKDKTKRLRHRPTTTRCRQWVGVTTDVECYALKSFQNDSRQLSA